MKLKGCTALVTGSSSGIGAATARALARRGCNVVVTWSKDERGGAKTAAACTALGAGTILSQLDVREDDQCREIVARIIRKWGRLDIVVNNAGTTRYCDPMNLDGLDSRDFLDLYAVNVVGAFQVTRAAAPHLSARPVAHVVNVASMAALNGRGSSIAYAASKGALVTMTKSLARVLGPAVRVNAVCPGIVQGKWAKKNLGGKAYESQLRFAANRSVLKAVPASRHVAIAIVSCISGSDMVTGDAIFVDGGAHLGTARLFNSNQA